MKAAAMTNEEYKAAVNVRDAEDCGACSEDEDLCLYHRGFEDGMKSLGFLVARLVDDTDLANDVYHQIQLNDLHADAAAER